MKVKELRLQTDADLAQTITEYQAKLATLAIDYRTKQVSNIKEISAVKRVIAQGLTLQRERELLAEGEVS